MESDLTDHPMLVCSAAVVLVVVLCILYNAIV